jgi:hypothetical protein
MTTDQPTSLGLRRINTRWGHRYELDGRQVDGVTTLLKDGLPKPALVGWGIKSVAEYVADNLDAVYGMQPMGRNAIVQALKQAPYSQRDDAARRGTEVHALAEKLIHGDEVEVPDALRGHVEAYARYLDEWQPEPVLVERPVAHRKGWYAGTLDTVVRLPDGRVCLDDIKTTRSGVYGETALQIAAYRFAEFYVSTDGTEQPMESLGITDTRVVWVRADGYDVINVKADEDAFLTFKYVATVARAARGLNDLVGAPILQESA